MKSLFQLGATCIVTLVFIGACGIGHDGSPADIAPDLRLVTESEPDNAYLDISSHTGELHVDVVDEIACHWIEIGQTESQRAYVYWPYGSSSNADGTVIFDKDREERARVGSSISTRGHLATELAPDMINCSQGAAGASCWAAGFEPLS